MLLKEFSDVQVVDSTSKTLKKLARRWAPSTSKVRPAAVKWHAIVSLKDGVPVAERLTEQRLHDSAGLPDGALAPGTLTLFDLGYLDVLRFIDAIERGADFLTRLKTNHNPVILRVHTGKGDRVKVRGMRLDDALAQKLLLDDAGALDLDLRLEADGKNATARVVAELAPSDGEFYWYLTSVAREVLSIDDVVEAYRLRWYIELFFKQLKSGAGLDTIAAWRPGAVAALVYSKLIVLCLARLFELSVEERVGRHATTQLALILTLTRCVPLLMADSYARRGITIAKLESVLCTSPQSSPAHATSAANAHVASENRHLALSAKPIAHARWSFGVDFLQQFQELQLSFSSAQNPKNLARASVEAREEVEGPFAHVFVLETYRDLVHLCGLGRRRSGPRLERGVLIEGQHHLRSAPASTGPPSRNAPSATTSSAAPVVAAAKCWPSSPTHAPPKRCWPTSASSLPAHHFRPLRRLPSSRWASD